MSKELPIELGKWLMMQTLTAFLASVLVKKYTNPSSDIINVLAGLDQVDAVFTDFVTALDATIKAGRTCWLFTLRNMSLG